MKQRVRWTYLALAAALLLSAGAAVLPALAEGEKLQMLVESGTEEGAELLHGADARVDLYLVATSPSEGVYRFLDGYGTDGMPEDADGWKALAQESAALSVDRKVPVVSGAPLGQWIDKDDAGDGLQKGLYLVVTRPAEIPEDGYFKSFEDENGETYLASELKAGEWTVTVAPEIVALPTKEADEEGVIRTDGPGEWINNLEVFLKPEFEKRLGAIEIVKDLLSFETSHEAFFLFQVEAELDGKNVYSNLVALRFDGYGEKRKLIENIPVGAQVTVTEVYSTPGYSIVGAGSGSLIVDADEVLEVRFENDYDDNRDKGGGIMNNFDYDIEHGEWSWSQE